MTPTATKAKYAANMKRGVKDYGKGEMKVRALNKIDIDVERGVFTAIMGPSGSGKSTLLHTLAGLDYLTDGKTFIGDIDLTTLNESQVTDVRREHIGFVFQAYNLIPSLDAAENIRLPLDIAGRKVDEDWYDQIVDVLGLRDRLDHLPAEMSGGQQQRVAVARALVAKPEIIFADEPSGNLDSKSSGELLAFMRRAVREFGQTIVMVTHDPQAASHADKVLFLEDGLIVDTMSNPTAEKVLDRMKKMGA
jgi:putative ABC transport system ATP-binding protein